jgi:hypothetical protein
VTDLHVRLFEQTDPRLGWQDVKDDRSRGYAYAATETPRFDVQLRGYGPRKLPNQPIGCCTGVDAAVKCNMWGNRVKGQVLGLDDAIRIYSRATQIDPFRGQYPPQDTGSSGLAAAKASIEFGLITRYEWIFTGVDGIYAALRAGRPVGVGARWDNRMFHPEPGTGLVQLGGGIAGGHQWTVTGYRRRYDAFAGLCWWGPWGLNGTGRFLIRRQDLAELLADDGDAHVTYRAGA